MMKSLSNINALYNVDIDAKSSITYYKGRNDGKLQQAMKSGSDVLTQVSLLTNRVRLTARFVESSY